MQLKEKKHHCKITLGRQAKEEFSIPYECGPSWWRILHNTVSAIETDGCPSCGEHAVKLMSFLHDLVNVDLDKPVYNPENVLGFEQLTKKLFKQARKQLAGSNGVMRTKQPAREKNGQTADNNFDSVPLTAVKPCNTTMNKNLHILNTFLPNIEFEFSTSQKITNKKKVWK